MRKGRNLERMRVLANCSLVSIKDKEAMLRIQTGAEDWKKA